MRLAKSIFVPVYLTAHLVAFVHALLELSGGVSLAWLGVTLASGATLLFFTKLLFQRTARTDPRLTLVLLASGVGAGLALAGTLARPDVGPGPLAYASSVGLLGNLLYVFWYSRLDRPEAPALAVGALLPDFAVQDLEGAQVRASAFRGAPTVLMFFRGNWCPLCMAQIRELAAEYRNLATRGVRVALVSPQSHEHTRTLADRFDVPFEFYVDVGGAAAEALGIYHAWGTPAGLQVLGYESDTVFPTVIVLDAEGRVRFAHQTDNYRVRPEPETFLAHLP